MALRQSALWITLAASSVVVQAQPIDQQTSVIYSVDSSVRTDLDSILTSHTTDLNGDQFPDLVWANEDGIYQALGTGSGGFSASVTKHDDTASSPDYLESARTITGKHIDLNQDGVPDFITKRTNNAVSSVVSRMTFFVSKANDTSMDIYSFPTVPLTNNDFALYDYRDLSNDGDAELITLGTNPAPGSHEATLKTFAVTLSNTGVPTAIAPQMEHTFNFPAAAQTFHLELVDMNGDQKLDAVFLLQNDSDDSAISPYDRTYADLVVYYQQDNLTWSAPSMIKEDIIIADGDTVSGELSTGLLALGLHGEDFDGDGHTDILTYHAAVTDGGAPEVISAVELFILWQNDDGSFTEQTLTNDYFFDLSGDSGLYVHDLNNDNKADILLTGFHLDLSDPMMPVPAYNVAWFTNIGDRKISERQFLTPEADYYSGNYLIFDDFNQDQQQDVLLSGTQITDINMGTTQDGLFFIQPDAFAPIATFTADNNSHDNAPFNVALTINENVTGLTEADVEITGGSLGGWQEVSVGLSYQFTVTPNLNEDTALSVKAQSFKDASQQQNLQTSATVIAAPVIIPADSDGDGILDELENGDFNGDGIDDSQQIDPGVDSGIGGGAFNPWLLLLALPLLFTQHSARAESQKSVVKIIEDSAYAGMSLGFTFLNPEDDNSGWRQKDDSKGSHGLHLGFRPNKHSFIEYSHQQFGKIHFKNNNPNITGRQSLRYSANSLLGGVYINEDQPYKVFVRSGLTELTTKSSSSLNNDQHNKILLATGLGLEWAGMKKWQLRFGADRYSADVHNLYFSAQYQFK